MSQKNTISANTPLISRLAGNVELLDFVGFPGRGSGVNGDLEKLPARIQKADHVLFIGLRGLVRYGEGARGVGFEKRTENFAGLFAGAVSGGGNDGDVQIVCEPAGQGGGVSRGQVFGDGGENGETVILRLPDALLIAYEK